jgi:hypothetical protein
MASQNTFYYSWIILSVLSFLYLLENFDRYLIAVSVIPYIDYSSYQYSLLVGPAFTVIYALGGLIFSLVYYDSSDGTQRKVSPAKFFVLFLSTVVFSVAFGLTALCRNFWQQVLVRVVMGLAQSVITPFSASIIRGIFPADQSGTAFSIFNTGVYLAFSMSLSLGVWLYDEYGWKAGYALFGIIGTGFAFVIPFFAIWSARSAAFVDQKHVTRQSYNPLLHDEIYNTAFSNDSVNMLSLVHNSEIGMENHESGSNLRKQNIISSNFHSSSSSSSSSPILPNSSEARSLSIQLEADVDILGNSSARDVERNPLQQKIENNNIEVNIGNKEIEMKGDSFLWLKNCSKYLSVSQIKKSWILAKNRLYRIVVLHWWNNPSIFLLCLATGIRLGAGYVWSSYTGPFFSNLFVNQENSIHCSYSYNAALVTTYSTMCSSSHFPYCVDGTCSTISKFPWHNKGMDPINLATYMSWVPLMGSALGNLLGGIVSDKVIRGGWISLWPSTTSSTVRDNIPTQEQQAKRTHWRALISGISTLLALPMVCIAFYLEFPGCFLIMIATGLVSRIE